MRVRIHITDGQRRALIAVLDRAPEPSVRVSAFTVAFDLDDPAAWLEARMAEWPRGAAAAVSARDAGRVHPAHPQRLRRPW
ncbi:hypothetical protein OIE67_25625 [Nonomuraea fuscirosea]|uniref:hypothetical protein n=1 Tax=Nonomuraea fuscirosea TaxID=1291556 RepID=UPI002DDAED87|nr:hypothetical protein [Nonomuraea fuscirosea]WSA57876.1 hypothetical protein OIE67_25625 [Nonomuraea fuscirosea]